MKKEFIPYEQALELKQLGFDEQCLGYYNIDPKHYFNICKKGRIRIGCIDKSIEEWESQFEQIGKEKGYTDEQIKEYGLYIKLAKQLNNA